MPELPDLDAYLMHFNRHKGERLTELRFRDPFVLRTVEPPVAAFSQSVLLEAWRLNKRIVFALEGGLFVVVHLMVAGRFQKRKPGAAIGRALMALDFESASYVLTEAAKKRRASVHLFSDESEVKAMDRGGLEPLQISLSDFSERLSLENRTLKRALTDQRLFSGIGNAYSDEILFAAKLPPIRLTTKLTPEEVERLYNATQITLTTWRRTLCTEAERAFPKKVTAFRPDMKVHGKYGQPCSECGSKIQRIRYASNECNYCATCQNAGKLFADRGLSRLLKKDWPKTLEELEERLANTPR